MYYPLSPYVFCPFFQPSSTSPSILYSNFADQQQPIFAQTPAANRESTLKIEEGSQNEVEKKEESLLLKNGQEIEGKSGEKENHAYQTDKKQNPNRNLTSETL